MALVSSPRLTLHVEAVGGMDPAEVGVAVQTSTGISMTPAVEGSPAGPLASLPTAVGTVNPPSDAEQPSPQPCFPASSQDLSAYKGSPGNNQVKARRGERCVHWQDVEDTT
jgi:hypothetical protein